MIEVTPASTVVVVRDGSAGVEVLLGRRPARHAFGGAWVFPGGSVDDDDRDPDVTGIDLPDGPWRAAALREVAEEVGIFLTDRPHRTDTTLKGRAVYESVHAAGVRFLPGRLAYLSNWVTPEGLPRRFDTRFYLAVVDSTTAVGPISAELEVVEWLDPADALERHERSEIELIMPTIAHLRLVAGFDTTAALDEHARSQTEIRTIQPRIVRRGDAIEVEIP